MAVQRAPGGGRKPQGEFPGKTAIFSTRITPELRADLMRAAIGSGRSLSQEVEFRLRNSLEMSAGSEGHNRALGLSAAWLASMVESFAGLRGPSMPDGPTWLDHRWAARAVRAAIDKFLQSKIPNGPDDPPARVKQMAEAAPAELAAVYGSPESVGAMLADSFLSMIETHDRPPRNRPSNEHYADSYYLAPAIREGFAARKQEERK